jgi:phage terminase large subunit-like protein
MTRACRAARAGTGWRCVRPAKQGKSLTASALGLFHLLADGEPGAEVAVAATDRAQAHLIFDTARHMVEANETLRSIVTVYRNELVVASTNSRFRVLSSEAPRAHGLNLSTMIYDEVHAAPDRRLWDALVTSMGARRQPLAMALTTAGFDKHSICYQLYAHAVAVRDGILDDPSFLPVLLGAGIEDDWTSPDVWARANPSLGLTVKLDYLEQECRRARDMPSYENTFASFQMWTEAETRGCMEQWEAGAVQSTARCAGGCASWRDQFHGDLSALVALFPDADGGYDVLVDAWLPEDNLADRVRRDRVPFDVWAREGILTLSPGNVIDHDRIEQRIRDLVDVDGFSVESVGIDPWNATQMLARLQADGIPAVAVPQTFAGLTSATKALEAAVLSGTLRHGGNPILRWCAANVTVETDSNENLRPSKKKSPERIDAIAALVNAFARALPAITGSVYDTRAPLLVDL